MLSPSKERPLYGDNLPPHGGRYADFYDLLRVTRAKFLRARKLSRPYYESENCFYSHRHNGIGCAIGCHLPPAVAEEMDGFNMSIDGFLRRRYEDDSRGLQIDALCTAIEAVIDVQAIGLNNLMRLQQLHDRATNCTLFLAQLEDLMQMESQLPRHE